MLSAGGTFLVKRADLDDHLWVLLSDPALDPEHVLIVNLTSWKEGKDGACILRPGDHPWIRRDTCVNYADGQDVRLVDLKKFHEAGELELREAFSPSVLERIRQGAGESVNMPLGKAQILVDQGLIHGDL